MEAGERFSVRLSGSVSVPSMTVDCSLVVQCETAAVGPAAGLDSASQISRVMIEWVNNCYCTR